MAVWLLAASLLLRAATAAKPPVIIVPGLEGSQLEAKLDKKETVSPFCAKKSDWFRLWMNVPDILFKSKCWVDNVRLAYNQKNNSIFNAPGVETRVPYWGSTEGFEELNPYTPAFKTMVQKMVSLGLEKNKTLRGAPYDFRYAPSSRVGADFILRLKELVEETYNSTGRRVSLVSHSMGCLEVLYLLNNQSQEWKDKYVEKWIPMSGPYGGAAEPMRCHASGDNEGFPTVSTLLARREQRTYETNHWLLPVPQYWGDAVLVSSPERNYTAHDLDDFFDDVGFPAGKWLRRRTQNLTSRVEAPGVDVVCMYSMGVPTAESFAYGPGGFDDVTPTIVNGEGDGTVNAVSLKLCERWTQKGAQTRSARTRVFSKITHTGMVTDEVVIQALLEELGLTAPGDSQLPILV